MSNCGLQAYNWLLYKDCKFSRQGLDVAGCRRSLAHSVHRRHINCSNPILFAYDRDYTRMPARQKAGTYRIHFPGDQRKKHALAVKYALLVNRTGHQAEVPHSVFLTAADRAMREYESLETFWNLPNLDIEAVKQSEIQVNRDRVAKGLRPLSGTVTIDPGDKQHGVINAVR